MDSASTSQLQNDRIAVDAEVSTPAAQASVLQAQNGAHPVEPAVQCHASASHGQDTPFNSTSAAARAGVLVGLLLARR